MTRHENPPLRHVLATLAGLTVAVLSVVLVLAAASVISEAAPASSSELVLGSPAFMAPYGEGWGTSHPRKVFNGGDPSGSVSKLSWKHWGEPTAIGRGMVPLLRPGGGYYARPGKLMFRADDLGSCPDGTYSYTRLHFRIAHRPGGPLGHRWRGWASPSGDICG